MENLKVDVVDTRPTSVTLSVEVPKNEVAGETEKVYNEIQKNAQVPGFRVGKAPMEFIKKNYTVTAREKVIENLIQRALLPALQAKNVEPISYPRIEKVTFDFDKPFTFHVRAEKSPEFKVKDYKGIKVKKEISPVNDAKVKESLESLRERNARLVESKAESVSADNYVLVDYEAYAEGKKVDDMTAKNQLIELSSPQIIAGFKEGLTGAKKDEEREIKVKFPEIHPNKKLANKEVIFKVKVRDIKEKHLPALDDEFAKDFGINTLVELETKVKESLEAEEKKRQDQEVEKQIVEHLLAANTFEVPESLVEEQLNYLINRSIDYFKRQGLPESAWQKNVEQWREKYRQEAERNVRLSYIFTAVGEEEKVTVTGEDLMNELENMKKANPGREEEVEKYFNENKQRIESHLKEEKIYHYIISQTKIKEEEKKA